MHVVRGNHTDGIDLVSLADMKEFLRVDHSDEDTTITALLDTAVAWAEDYTNRLFHPNGSADFYLSRWRPACLAFGPVTAIDAVKYDVPGATYTLDASKYYYETAHDGSMMIYFHDVPDLEEYNAHPVKIECTVGLAPQENVKHAVRMLVAHWYENRRAVVMGTNPVEVPIAVEALLNSERIIDLRQ
jgi:uncharacterized phiE125 gp8 family phage protein